MVLAILLSLVCSVLASVIHSRYSYLCEGLKFLNVVALNDSTTADEIASDKDLKSYNPFTPYQKIHHYKAVLNNSFIFGSLLYDQQQNLALSIFLWVKGWAAQGDQFEELFYRSSSLATLLSSQVNAEANGAVFVPYLTATVYTSLANAFAADAAKYPFGYKT